MKARSSTHLWKHNFEIGSVTKQSRVAQERMLVLWLLFISFLVWRLGPEGVITFRKLIKNRLGCNFEEVISNGAEERIGRLKAIRNPRNCEERDGRRDVLKKKEDGRCCLVKKLM